MVTVFLPGIKVLALLFRLRVGEFGTGLGEGEDLTVCEIAGGAACVVNIECT